jgi:hypothetical protein
MLQKHLDSQKNLILPTNSNNLVGHEDQVKKSFIEGNDSATDETYRSETENINPGTQHMKMVDAENTCGTANETR